MKDTIIVLGGGIDEQGNLPLIPKYRIEKGVELFKQNSASTIIMSGKWGFLASFVPARPEAIAMKEYAASLGVPDESILVETNSMDTIGNAYFTKTTILEPKKWFNVCIVTSEYHMNRTEYIFNKVLGPNYSIEYVSADSRLESEDLAQKQTTDKKVLEFTQEHFKQITDGDDTATFTFMQQFPGYSDNPKYTKEELAQLIAWFKN